MLKEQKRKKIPLEGDGKSQILKLKEEKVGNFCVVSRRAEAVAGVFTEQMSSPITQNGVLSDFQERGLPLDSTTALR